jgi:hypothetical protein
VQLSRAAAQQSPLEHVRGAQQSLLSPHASLPKPQRSQRFIGPRQIEPKQHISSTVQLTPTSPQHDGSLPHG